MQQMTRAERSALNRAEHARKRQQLEAEWREAEQQKREQKRLQREANRAAWWARYGTGAPSIEEADPFEDLRDEREADPITEAFATSEVEQPSADEWRVSGKDGHGYEVQRTYRVTLQDGESFDLPTAEDAAEFIRMAIEANREQGREQWTEGARFSGYEVERATKSAITIRHDGSKVTRFTPRVDHDGRSYVVLKPRNERNATEIRLYADQMAA